jgi:amino acid transporter
MSLYSIFNSLWNMDLTFIVNFLLVTFSLLTILGLLLIFLDYLLPKKIIERYDNLSELQKNIIVIILIIIVTMILSFVLSILGIK